MKAAVWTERNTVRVMDVDEPAGPRSDEVKVATDIAAVCATEFHIMSGEFPNLQPPMVMGHEVAGVVTEVGADVKGLSKGTRVVLEPTIGCGQCFVCAEGMTYLCPRDWHFVGGTRAGGMAEFFCAPARNLHVLPESISPVAACLLEPLGCCVHGLDMVGDIAGKDVLITGAGFSGILFVQLVRPTARKIVVTGTRDVRLRTSLKFGADAAIDVRKDELVPAARRYFGERGPDVILECTGSDGIFDPMIELVARHGSILIYSFMPHSQTISIKDLQQKEPSVFLATSCADCIPRAIELVAAGRVDLDSMVTHRFKLDQAEEAYRVARDQKDTCLKAIVEVK